MRPSRSCFLSPLQCHNMSRVGANHESWIFTSPFLHAVMNVQAFWFSNLGFPAPSWRLPVLQCIIFPLRKSKTDISLLPNKGLRKSFLSRSRVKLWWLSRKVSSTSLELIYFQVILYPDIGLWVYSFVFLPHLSTWTWENIFLFGF